MDLRRRWAKRLLRPISRTRPCCPSSTPRNRQSLSTPITEKPVPEGRAPAPAQPAAGEPPAEEAHWGREVVPGTAGGHPCLTYARRPGSLAELLSGTGRWAEREFLVQGERRLSYGAFTGAVARVAAYLRGLGVRPGQRVMLLGFNQIEWVVAFWAAQTVGAVAVLGNA